MIGQAVKAPKVLLLGFSVTADSNGYVPVVKRLLSSVGITVDYCGVGGVIPTPLPHILTTVNAERGPYTHVFLEIATSVYGMKLGSTDNDGLDLLYDIFCVTQKTGAQIGMINLYRSNFDYQYHYFDMLIEALCARYSVPLLDLGHGLLAQKGAEFCATLLRDTVHTSDAGSQFQGEEVAKFVAATVVSSSRNKVIPVPRFNRHALDARELVPWYEKKQFKRSGLLINYIEIGECSSERISLPIGTKIIGVSFLSGPQSGRFLLRLGSEGREVKVEAYDEHCFYERYNFMRFAVAACDSVTIEQLPGRPDIKLRKGEVDSGPRIAKIVALHTITNASC